MLNIPTMFMTSQSNIWISIQPVWRHNHGSVHFHISGIRNCRECSHYRRDCMVEETQVSHYLFVYITYEELETPILRLASVYFFLILKYPKAIGGSHGPSNNPIITYT